MAKLEFEFAWESAASPDGPWAHLFVVDFRGHEEMSSLFRYELTLLARDPSLEVDPHDLVRQRATFRLRTGTLPEYRVVHGVIAEAEELGPTAHGLLYRVVLRPPIFRAKYRRRCRIFLEKTTREIVDAVLRGEPTLHLATGATTEPDDGLPSFRPADERYAWRVTDASRIDDRSVRPYCVQYNESDLDFVARLLEAEGIAYHYEDGHETSLLVLADRDGGRARLAPFLPLGHVTGRSITSVRLGARLRPKAVTFHDYNWKQPKLDMAARAGEAGDLAEVHYPGGFVDTPAHGKPLANALVDRYAVEADYAVLDGTCRLLGAGSIFALEASKARYEGEYLVTKIDLRGDQTGALMPGQGTPDEPFAVTLECARRGKGAHVEESRFRPAKLTPWPRILGSQTGFVTAEPSSSSEIHVGGPEGAEVGCVRVRFHWDTESDRHAIEPTSCWIRVNHPFAGVGEGGVWHPRVGVEVIVEYEDGDPDRPIVTGRVYNGANRPPAPASGADTISTFKSFSSPGGATFNEFLFDDAAGGELIKLHAGKDWHAHVNHDRVETIQAMSLSKVGVDRTEQTGANRFTSVAANNSEQVAGNHSHATALNHFYSVGLDLTQLVGVNKKVSVGADVDTEIGGDETHKVAGSQAVTIEKGPQTVSVEAGGQTIDVKGGQTIEVEGGQTNTVKTGDQINKVEAGNQTVEVSGDAKLDVKGDFSQEVGANTDFTHWGVKNEIRHGASFDTFIGLKNDNVVGGAIETYLGALIELTAGVKVDINAAVNVDVKATKLTNHAVEAHILGAKAEESEVTVTVNGPVIEVEAVNVKTTSIMIVA